MERKEQLLRLIDLGSVTRNTHATNLQYPWFEPSAPPFNRICNVCEKRTGPF
jgi:hypothetical protein